MGWMGGANYRRNLVYALEALPDHPVETVLIAAPATVINGFPNVKVVRTSLVDMHSKVYFARKMLSRSVGRDLMMERLLRTNGVDVLSHSGHLGPRGSVPTIGWIPDFQHRRMPEFFEPSEIMSRDRTFKRLCDSSTALVVSSADALHDLAEFAPSAVSKCHVLHFTAGIGNIDKHLEFDVLSKRYLIDRPYIHLPAQFWKHKNHRIVIEALALLKSRGQSVLIVSTGHTEDRRQPAYFPSLIEQARARGLQASFRVLGLVPYQDLSALMKHSVAIINPSLFEGWSTTVEEAKSLGKKVILSDIPVHREQDPSRGIYFDPHDAGYLADALSEAVRSYSCDEENVYFESARQMRLQRFLEFAERYKEILQKTVGDRILPPDIRMHSRKVA